MTAAPGRPASGPLGPSRDRLPERREAAEDPFHSGCRFIERIVMTVIMSIMGDKSRGMFDCCTIVAETDRRAYGACLSGE